MTGLAIFLAFLVWLGAFGREAIARAATSMAGIEQKMLNTPKQEDSMTWSTSSEWWDMHYGPVKLWTPADGGRYQDVSQRELDAELTEENNLDA